MLFCFFFYNHRHQGTTETGLQMGELCSQSGGMLELRLLQLYDKLRENRAVHEKKMLADMYRNVNDIAIKQVMRKLNDLHKVLPKRRVKERPDGKVMKQVRMSQSEYNIWQQISV